MSGDPAEAIRDVKLRVAAELGRARMPLGRSVGLGPGAVIELDRAENDPIDLVVNGRRYATGRLVLVNGSEWAFHIEEILAPDPAEAAPASH